MRMRSFWAVVLLLPALAVSVRAQTYIIKVKGQPDVGKSVVHRDVDRQIESMKFSDAAGKLLDEEKLSETSEEVHTETVLEKGDKQPRKFKVNYEKASLTKGGMAVARSYQGRTILFELKDGKYQATAEGQPALLAKDLEELAKKATDHLKSPDEELFMPGKPVNVGDSWTIDSKVLAALDFTKEAELDTAKSKAEAKLVKAYIKNGKQFGVIAVDMKLLLKAVGPFKFDSPGTFDVKCSLDTAINGSSTAGTMILNGKLWGRSQLVQEGKRLTMEMNMESSGKKEQSEEK